MMNNKTEGKAVWVFLNADGQGLAVELNNGHDGQPFCPKAPMFYAHGIYDVTNERTIKWKLGDLPPTLEQMATIQLLAANPKGRFLRGRMVLTDKLVAAYTGKPVEKDEDVMWLRVALLDPNTNMVFPTHLPLLQEYRFHPDDQPLVDALLNANGVAA